MVAGGSSLHFVPNMVKWGSTCNHNYLYRWLPCQYFILLMMGAWRPKHAEKVCSNKICILLHHVSVLFNLKDFLSFFFLFPLSFTSTTDSPTWEVRLIIFSLLMNRDWRMPTSRAAYTRDLESLIFPLRLFISPANKRRRMLPYLCRIIVCHNTAIRNLRILPDVLTPPLRINARDYISYTKPPFYQFLHNLSHRCALHF